MDNADLARMQLHENEWYARRARLELQRRAPSTQGAAQPLAAVASRHDDERMRLRGLWSLNAIGAPLVSDGWRDSSDNVRAWMVRLTMDGVRGGELPPELEELLDDPSPVVRLALASAMQRLRTDARWTVAERLLSHAEDADDANLPYLLWYGIEPLVAIDPAHALALGRGTSIDLFLDLLCAAPLRIPNCSTRSSSNLARSKTQPAVSCSWRKSSAASPACETSHHLRVGPIRSRVSLHSKTPR